VTDDLSTPDPPPLTAEQVAQIAAHAAVAAVKHMQADNELKLYTTEEAGVLLGKGQWWVEDQIRQGLIPYTRVGRTPMLSADHIRAIHAQGEVDPATRRPKRQARPRIKRVAA
jgi:hypothetical protein